MSKYNWDIKLCDIWENSKILDMMSQELNKEYERLLKNKFIIENSQSLYVIILGEQLGWNEGYELYKYFLNKRGFTGVTYKSNSIYIYFDQPFLVEKTEEFVLNEVFELRYKDFLNTSPEFNAKSIKSKSAEYFKLDAATINRVINTFININVVTDNVLSLSGWQIVAVKDLIEHKPEILKNFKISIINKNNLKIEMLNVIDQHKESTHWLSIIGL